MSFPPHTPLDGSNSISSPLICTALDAPIAWRSGSPILARQFLADTASLAARLSSDQAVINICKDRYGFAVVWAAALQCGVVSWMPPNDLPETLGYLQARPDQTFSVLGDEALHKASASNADTPQIAHQQAAVCLLTSGSTGASQPHFRTWGELVENIQAASWRFAALLKLNSTDTKAPLKGLNLVATVPPQHSYGLESSVLLAWLAGAAFESEAVFFPADIAQALARLPRPRALVSTPFHLKNLLMSGVDLPEIDGVLCATSPLSQTLALEAEKRLGGVLLEIYGCTETGQLATRRTANDLLWQTLGGVRLQSVQHEGQERCTAQGGHVRQATLLADTLLLHSPQQFEWLARANDLVHVAGKRSSLAHLNHHLNSIDGVSDGAFWMPHELADEVVRPVAFVVAPGLTAAQIIEALRHKVDGVFVPRKIVHVDQLPRGGTGKLAAAVLERFAHEALNPTAQTLSEPQDLRQTLPERHISGSEAITIFCPISTQHPSLAGHFPGQPVLPGVVLLSAVLKALLKNPELQRAVGEHPVLSSVKFLGMVSPVAGLSSPPVAASASSGPPWGQVILGSGPATDLRASEIFELQTNFVLSDKAVRFEMHEGTRLVLRGFFALAPPSNEGVLVAAI
jgi:acyl-coenzyme A synthetase/AMP-(fatty) acid ligase